MTTIDSLWKFELSLPVLFDYFGSHNMTDERILIIRGLYKGLQLMEVPKKEVEKAYFENALDKLIHDKYKGRRSEYYETFCKENMYIGKTCLLNDEQDCESDCESDDSDNIRETQLAYEKYGEQWVEDQRKVLSENLGKIFEAAEHKNPSLMFYDRIYKQYGSAATEKYRSGKEVEPITQQEVDHWSSFA